MDFEVLPELPSTEFPSTFQDENSPQASPPRLPTAALSSVTSDTLRPTITSLPDKPKKRPTVTPRTFTRFFTPRSSLSRGKKLGASRKVLRDLTASATNRRGLEDSTAHKSSRHVVSSPIKGPVKGNDLTSDGYARGQKRRILNWPDSTPELSSPLRTTPAEKIHILLGGDANDLAGLSDSEASVQEANKPAPNIEPIHPSRFHGPLGGPLCRELSFPDTSFRRFAAGCTADWQSETSNFYSRAEDRYECVDTLRGSPHRSFPFSSAACTTNSLVAVGDEDGGIRLLESAKDGKPSFSKDFLKMRAHANSIFDLTFSSDDMLLATAGGDQMSQIIDMRSQKNIYTLAGHSGSIKQIRFQPGSMNKVIATSSRDGCVQIWDLRCKVYKAPVFDFQSSMEPSSINPITTQPSSGLVDWAVPVNSINEAHARRAKLSANVFGLDKTCSDQPGYDGTQQPKGGATARRNEVSITALQFLQPSREHILVTASEANASVKVWDLRTTHKHRRGKATPLSTTRQPESHDRHRLFGLTSMALSGDGGRLYTLCLDSTIYAYSTEHLVLGHAPELSIHPGKPRRAAGVEKEGLGPLYGFRHAQFSAASFFVKMALRPAKDDRTELLAVGSSSGCGIVFPTNEQYMQSEQGSRVHSSVKDGLPQSVSKYPSRGSRPALSRSYSGVQSPGLPATRLVDTIPVYTHGSALIRGHEKEVTTPVWTHDGELVTIGDDLIARCWREGSKARDLRMGGEDGGRRWGCGWADVDDEWDDDD